ncbi:hypothetical protein SLS58_009227 [Diplodia intermedia]|uniref:Ankyrin repeat domain-containing protein n=1 Tax=Diplodia intermedia TaxID=856260 RepID=A0ABR3TDJ5_9PEZI
MDTSPQRALLQRISQSEPPKEVTRLVRECILGRLDQVKEIFQGYLENPDHAESRLYGFWPVLLTAIEYNQPEIVRYLLSLGIPLERMHVEQAIKTESIPIFNVLLHHGWKINQPMGNYAPPALAAALDSSSETGSLPAGF